jgi:Mrp family chromosome partitioning ATPase/capsular polysaccharide biosynthesis protein
MATALATGAAALVFSLLQSPLYQGTAEVLVTQQNPATALSDSSPATVEYIEAERFVETQAAIAAVPLVAERVLQAARVRDRTAADLLAQTVIEGQANRNIVQFQVTDPSRALAGRLTQAYARQFTRYRRELDTAAIRRTRTQLSARIRQLEAGGARTQGLIDDLRQREEELKTLEALQTSNAYIIRGGSAPQQVAPRTLRNTLLALVLGLMLGIGLAFAREALDTRLRSADEVGDALGLPLLARLSRPPPAVSRRADLVMLTAPHGSQAEAFRMLKTNLEFVTLDRAVKTILITSAIQGEGKSTTAANLAVALARAGRHVGLVDLDLRRPTLHELFKVDQAPGLTEVSLGRLDLESALHTIDVVPIEERRANGAAYVEASRRTSGVLELLTTGPLPPNAGEFVGSRTLTDLLLQLRQQVDFLLLDTPPLLPVGDAISLSKNVDGLVVLTRLDLLRRPTLSELGRVLGISRAPSLGFVLTSAQIEEEPGYGTYAYYESLVGSDDSGRSPRRQAVGQTGR